MFSIYLVFTVFLTGGIVMLLEILGARLIAPFFGSSVYIWTSIISVTLLSLALGYWQGGRIADRRPSAKVLYVLIATSGAYLFFALFIKNFVLNLSIQFGLRLGSLISGLILFSPTLFLLGTVTPFVVKLYADRMERLGTEVGILYCLSTIGSVIGTLLTGFFLIPQFGISNILVMTANLLILISIGYFLFFARNFKFLALLALFGLNLLFSGESRLLAKEVDGHIWRELYKQDSFYGRLKVIEVDGLKRFLYMDGVNQGGIDINRGFSTTAYTYVLEMLSRMACPGAKRALVVGLGVGALPVAFSRHGIATDAVDIDEKVVELYQRYFRINGEDINTFIEDGRSFIKKASKKYDIVVVDVFLGENVPSHLLTIESFKEIGDILTEGGALVINFVGMTTGEPDSTILFSIQKTLLEVFPEVHTFYKKATPKKRVGNVFFLATFKKPSFDYRMDITMPLSYASRIYDILNTRLEIGGDRDIFILRDDYNPVEFYTAKTMEEFRRNIITSLDRDLLLN